MNATTGNAAHATVVGVDVAKTVFQLAVANSDWKITEKHRLTRPQFERWFANRRVDLVIMEACGSAHHWARWLRSLGIEVKLLPAAHIRAHVKRNKTDAADAAALPRVTPTPTNADNPSGSCTLAACIDWRPGDADSMSARTIESPQQMPDIRLQAQPYPPFLSINFLFVRGSPYRWVRAAHFRPLL
jgi:hypothetical protein